MGIVSLTRYETQPGRMTEHLELTVEAVTRLRGLGQQAVAMQPIAGTDVGSISMSVGYANNSDYTTAVQKIQADAGWQEFYGRAMSSAAAVQVEASLFADLDPAFQPAADRPLGVILATQWRAKPGRLEDFVGKVMEAGVMTEKMGARHRPMQSVIGLHPLSMLIAETFADLDAYGEYADKLDHNDEWQAFWAVAMQDPSADLLRSGVYVNISGD